MSRELKALTNPRCTACELHKIASKVCIPGEGTYTQKAFVVGEAPGKNEDQQGRVFIGAAGRLLRREMAAVGLRPSKVFLTNAVKCYPNGTPAEEQVKICGQYLEQEIRLAKPSWILCLGATSMQAVTGCKGISALRGQVLPSLIGDGLVLPTFHPAYLLRDSRKLPDFRNDLSTFATLVEYDL